MGQASGGVRQNQEGSAWPVERIRKEVLANEALHGTDYVCPSWKQFVRSEPANHQQKDDGAELAKRN